MVKKEIKLKTYNCTMKPLQQQTLGAALTSVATSKCGKKYFLASILI